MAIVERHESPGLQLTLFVDLTDGDWTIGFEGFPYHTHGDILSETEYAGTPEQATRAFVKEIVESLRPIVIWRVDGRIRDLSMPHKLDRSQLQANLDKYGLPGETFELRYWNGQ